MRQEARVRRVQRWRRSAAVGLALGMALAAVGPARTQEPEAALVAAAKSEGKLVFYSALIAALSRPVADLFEKKYGITVELLEPRASETRERIRTEQAAGRFIGDVTAGSASTLALQAQDGVFQPHGDLPNVKKLSGLFAGDGTLFPFAVNLFSLLANTDLVSAADMPKSWHDLLDPKWKGKILSDDPRANGAGHVLFAAMVKKFGRPYVEALYGQNPVISRDIAVNERRVARGEFAFYIPLFLVDMPDLKGLPVKAVVPEEGVAYIPFAAGMLKNAPHPNAARLFLNFLLSDEVQGYAAQRGFRSAIGYLPESLAPEIRQFADVKLLGTSPPDEQAAMLKLAAEIYK